MSPVGGKVTIGPAQPAMLPEGIELHAPLTDILRRIAEHKIILIDDLQPWRYTRHR